jgi:hypothetical protein
MSSRDFSRVRRLFEAAMNLPVSQQEAFVQRFCVDDYVLRDEVLGLLESDREMDSARRLLDEGGLKRTPLVEVPEQIGPYRAVSVIASGGMGMVYEGIQESPRRRVAIKTLLIGPRDERALARFQAEIDVLARLEHPSIARIYSAGTYEQRMAGEVRELPFYVMEYIEGAASLTEYSEREKLTVRQRIQLFCKVCEAIDFAHGQGVLHRDLKPGNILVNRDGDPKIIDFGTARLLGEDSMIDSGITRSGEIIGTLNYMSPEQISPSEDTPPDVRSDVYALGCLLYELLVGKPAYTAKGRTFAEMVASVIFGTLEPPSHWAPDLSKVLDLVCMKAMSHKREDRYESASDLAADLNRFLDAREVKAAPPSLGVRVKLFMRRQPAIVTAIFVFLLANGIGIYFMRRAKATQTELTQLVERAWAQPREAELLRQNLGYNFQTIAEAYSGGRHVRGDAEELLKLVTPLRDVEGVGEPALLAIKSEVRAAVVAGLRFPARAEELYEEARLAWVAAYGESDHSTMRVRLAQLVLEHERGAREGFKERLDQFREDLSAVRGGVEALRSKSDHLAIYLTLDEVTVAVAEENLELVEAKLERAEASASKLLHEQQRKLGANSLETLETTWLLGQILVRAGRNSAAVRHLQLAHVGLIGALGDIHPRTLECQLDCAIAMIDLRRPGGEEMLKEAERELSLILGEQHPSALYDRAYSSGSGG